MTEITLAESIEQARLMHGRSKKFSGRNLRSYVDKIAALITEPGWTLLDYGCGKARVWYETDLLGRLKLSELTLHDPAMPGGYALHDKYRLWDIVVCSHVLEHIPPDEVAAVVDHLIMRARRVLFVVVPTTPSHRLLPNGMDAHLTVRPREWWEQLFMERLQYAAAVEDKRGLDFRWIIE